MHEQALLDVVHGQPGGDGQGHDGDELGGVASDDGAAQDDAGGRVGDDLDEAPGVVVDDGLGRRGERHLGDPDLAALGEGVGLGQAHVGDLRFGEHRRGGLVVVHEPVGAVVYDAHGVLGDLAALHLGHRRERQLAGDVAGGVDVRDAGPAVGVDGDVATVRLDADGVEAQAFAVGHRADGQDHVAAGGHPAVVAVDRDPVAVAFDGLGPGALVEADAAAQEVGFEGGCHLRVLGGQDLLAADHERHVAAEGLEHVDELHAGDAGADDDEVVGHLGRRVGLAGGEDALAVDGGPVGDAGAAAGGEHDHVGFDLLEAVGGLGNHLVGALEHSGALDEPDVLVLEQ